MDGPLLFMAKNISSFFSKAHAGIEETQKEKVPGNVSYNVTWDPNM